MSGPVPAPITVLIFGIGLAGLAGADVRRKQKKKAVGNSLVIIYQYYNIHKGTLTFLAPLQRSVDVSF